MAKLKRVPKGKKPSRNTVRLWVRYKVNPKIKTLRAKVRKLKAQVRAASKLAAKVKRLEKQVEALSKRK